MLYRIIFQFKEYDMKAFDVLNMPNSSKDFLLKIKYLRKVILCITFYMIFCALTHEANKY